MVQTQVPVTFGVPKCYCTWFIRKSIYLPGALENVCVSGMVSTSMKSSSWLFEGEGEISCVSGTRLIGFGGLGTGCTSTLTVCCSATKMTDPFPSVSLVSDIVC